MMQQLYVDGKLVDINDNTEVTLNFKSNLLTGAGGFVGNSSQTITLPSTVKNRDIFGHADVVQGGGTVPYVFHDVQYFRNGVQIIKDGIGRLISMKDDEIEFAITWGIRSALDAMLTTDDTLNDLTTNAAITFNLLPQVSDYNDAISYDVFYASMDTLRYPGENTYYRLHVGVAGRNWDTSDIAETPSSYLHPSVRMNWLFQQLTNKYGVAFDYSWVFEELDELIVPLISKVPNEITYNGGYKALCYEPTSWGGLSGNYIEFRTTNDSVIIAETSSDPQSGHVTCATAFKGVGRFSIYLYIDNLTQVSYPVFKAGYGYAIDVTIGGRTQRCTLLPEDYYIMANEISGGKVGITATGYFPVEMLTNDTLTIRLSAIHNGVVDINIAGDIHVNGGNLWINDIIGDINEVQPTQQYPVEGNLPEIKPIDLVKFLCAICGAFPMQSSTAETIFFYPVNQVFNYSHAVDWTMKLLSETDRPVAEESGYTVDSWCRRNWWRWKEDDTVYGDYDGSIDIDNETIAESRDIMTMPFAATDGNNIPMYVTERKWDGDAGTWYYDTKWNKVQPRVLRMFKGAGDKAFATFDGLEMETIINNRYGYLQNTLRHPVVIKERFTFTDIELAELDETKPIYLSQHGAYFALLELTLSANGIADATLLKLRKED